MSAEHTPDPIDSPTGAALCQPVRAPAPAVVEVALATWYDGPACIALPPCRWLGAPGPTCCRTRRRPAQGLPEGDGVNPGGAEEDFYG